MEDEELALFAGSVTRAVDAASGEALDRALDDLGWRDALAADRRAAVSLLFDAAGRANATSSALDWLLADALGAPRGCGRRPASPAHVGAAGPGRVRALRGGRARVGHAGPPEQGRWSWPRHARDWSRSWCPSRHLRCARSRASIRRSACSRCAATSSWADDPDCSRRRVGRRARAGPARAEPRADRRGADDARAGPPARHRTRAVRAAHRDVPSRAPPAGRQPDRHRGGRQPRWPVPGTSPLRSSPPWPRAWRDEGRGPRPSTASRCWPGSASPPSTPFHRFYKRVVVLDQLLGAGSALTRQLGDRRAGHGYPASVLRPLSPARPGPLVRRGRSEGVLDGAVDYASRRF